MLSIVVKHTSHVVSQQLPCNQYCQIRLFREGLPRSIAYHDERLLIRQVVIVRTNHPFLHLLNHSTIQQSTCSISRQIMLEKVCRRPGIVFVDYYGNTTGRRFFFCWIKYHRSITDYAQRYCTDNVDIMYFISLIIWAAFDVLYMVWTFHVPKKILNLGAEKALSHAPTSWWKSPSRTIGVVFHIVAVSVKCFVFWSKLNLPV